MTCMIRESKTAPVLFKCAVGTRWRECSGSFKLACEKVTRTIERMKVLAASAPKGRPGSRWIMMMMGRRPAGTPSQSRAAGQVLPRCPLYQRGADAVRCGEVRSGQVGRVTRPKSETMRVTRQLASGRPRGIVGVESSYARVDRCGTAQCASQITNLVCHETSDSESVPKSGQVQLRGACACKVPLPPKPSDP